MKVIAFAASNSKSSINKKLVTYAAGFLKDGQVEILDLNDFVVPLYSQDLEAQEGHPEAAKAFLAKINEANGVLISFAEHNGSYTAAYKNLFDWCSRIQQKVYADKNIVALSTSPGAGGGRNVLAAALNSLPYFGATIKASVTVPSFYESFDMESNILKSEELRAQVQNAVALL